MKMYRAFNITEVLITYEPQDYNIQCYQAKKIYLLGTIIGLYFC